MSGPRPSDEWDIGLGRYRLPFNRKLIFVIILVAFLVALSIFGATTDGYQNRPTWVPQEIWGFLRNTAVGLTAIIGVIAGVLVQPLPRAADHTQVASRSVERLYELSHTTDRIRETVTDTVNLVEDYEARFSLINAQNELLTFEAHYARMIVDWDEVSAGVSEAVKESRIKGKRLWAEMVQEENSKND